MGVIDYLLALGVPLLLLVALLPLGWLWLIGMTRWPGPWKVLPWSFYALFMVSTIIGCVRFYALDLVEEGFFVAALVFYAGALISSGIAWAVRSGATTKEQHPDASGGDGP